MARCRGYTNSSSSVRAGWPDTKPAARFANFQATSAAAAKPVVEESKESDFKFEQLLAAMAAQSAQTEKGMAQMREQQAESQQAQSKLM